MTFRPKIPDGANTVVIGQFGNGKVSDGNLAMIGGNCAIHGFDREGNDAYWTVTGDNISAMALVDIDNDGLNEVGVLSLRPSYHLTWPRFIETFECPIYAPCGDI